MAKENEDPQSGPIGNVNPNKRGRGSGEGPRKDVTGSGRRPKSSIDNGKGAPDKGKSK